MPRTPALQTLLVVALSALPAGVAAQDVDTRKVLDDHRRGLEEGSDKVHQGAKKLEALDPMDLEGMVDGVGDVAEGFCTMVTANADAFAQLGVDFSGLVGSAGGSENAARYSQAEDLCGEVQARTEDFALSGCTDIVVGERTTLTTTTGDGRYRFTANKPGVLDIATRGNSATLTGIAPGIVTVKAERTDKKAATASEVVHSLVVKSINAGEPVQLGMYNARGRRIEQVDVPVDVLPRGAARRIVYRPDDERLLRAAGDAGGTLTLRGHAPGTTTVRAMTACDRPTGASLQVEIVPCTANVYAELRKEQDKLNQRKENILAAISDVLNDPEFERALREFEGNAKELAYKLAELAIALAAPKAAPSAEQLKRAKDMHDYISHVADARSLVSYLAKILQAGDGPAGTQQRIDVGAEASLEALAKSADALSQHAKKKAGKAGLLNTTLQLFQAGKQTAQDVGTSIGAAERLEELGIQLDGVVRELEDVWRRMELCKDRRQPQDGPQEPEPAREPRPPKSRSRSAPPDEGAPPKRAKVVEIDDNDTSADTEAPVEPPTQPPKKPPGSPASPAAMATLMHENQCPGWEPVAQKQTGVFTALAGNMTRLGEAYDTQEAEVLAPLVEHLEGIREALQLFVEVGDRPDDQRAAGLQQVGDLLARHDPEKLAEHAPRLEGLAIQSQACSGLLRDSFEVKIEELRTRY